jgi:hypothetical protein
MAVSTASFEAVVFGCFLRALFFLASCRIDILFGRRRRGVFLAACRALNVISNLFSLVVLGHFQYFGSYVRLGPLTLWICFPLLVPSNPAAYFPVHPGSADMVLVCILLSSRCDRQSLGTDGIDEIALVWTSGGSLRKLLCNRNTY